MVTWRTCPIAYRITLAAVKHRNGLMKPDGVPITDIIISDKKTSDMQSNVSKHTIREEAFQRVKLYVIWTNISCNR